MTLARLISVGARAAVMIAVGTALIALPLAATLSAEAVLLGFLVGTITVGLGISGTAAGGRGTLPVSAHAVYDRLLALGLLLSAIGFGIAGQDLALGVFGAAGASVLLTAVTTVYSAAARPSTL